MPKRGRLPIGGTQVKLKTNLQTTLIMIIRKFVDIKNIFTYFFFFYVHFEIGMIEVWKIL